MNQFDKIETLDELCDVITLEPQDLYLKMVPNIIEALNHIHYSYNSNFIRIFLELAWRNYVINYHEDEKKNAMQQFYNIIRAFTSKLSHIGSDDEYDYMDVCAFICLDDYRFTNNDIEIDEATYRKFYKYLINIYITSEYCEDLLRIAISHDLYRNPIPETNRKLKELLDSNLEYKLDLLVLLKIIQSIKSDVDKKISEFPVLISFIHEEIEFSKSIWELIDRYDPYTNKETDKYILNIIYAYKADIDPYNYRFISRLLNVYNSMIMDQIDEKIAQSLINDVSNNPQLFGHDVPKYIHHYTAYRTHFVNTHYSIDNFNEIESRYNDFMKKREVINSANVAIEATGKLSGAMHSAQHKIYSAFKAFKNSEDKVDSQLTKLTNAMRKMVTGDTRSEIIEGKKFSVLGILKKVLHTAAVFNFSKVGGILFLIVRYCMRKKTLVSERRKIIQEINVELQLIDEKIEDARGDGNRDAKYALMRTKAELQKTLEQIKYGFETDEKITSHAKQVLNQNR